MPGVDPDGSHNNVECNIQLFDFELRLNESTTRGCKDVADVMSDENGGSCCGLIAHHRK
jgi:hypothetical protein